MREFMSEQQWRNLREISTPKHRGLVHFNDKMTEPCIICGTIESVQACHLIPYRAHLTYGFNPDFLDLPSNIVPACRKHNKWVELPDEIVEWIIEEMLS